MPMWASLSKSRCFITATTSPGTASLLHTLTEFGCIPVVFSSSCAVYGKPERLPIPEEHPQRPINPYGHSKLFVERMLADLGTASGLSWMALRYFNAAGADPNGEIGEAHEPETHLIPLVLAAARNGVPVRIFGDDYETSDGRPGDPPVLIGDAGRARALLGWQPKHSDLATQIKDAWRWMQARQ